MKANIKLQKQKSLTVFWNKLPYVLGFFSLLLILATIILNVNNISNAFTNFLSNQLKLKVEHMYIQGVENTNVERLRQSIQIKKGQPIFSVSTQQIREDVEMLPWVRLAQVQRTLPNSLKIKIIEHKPIATIKLNETKWTLNSKGELIDIVNDKFDHLLELSGEQSQENAASLFSLFADWPNLLFLAKQAEYIGQRRWNLYLENGIIILLPEEQVRYALKALKILDNQQRVLNKDKIKIDLRNINKHIVVDENVNTL